jgi:hypothetical protein
LSERHQASIIEFENFNSVKASRRRRTPVAISSSTWAFTFSTPASANTTGVVSDGVVPRLASISTAELFPRTFRTFLRELSSRRPMPRIVPQELRDVSDRPMINPHEDHVQAAAATL